MYLPQNVITLFIVQPISPVRAGSLMSLGFKFRIHAMSNALLIGEAALALALARLLIATLPFRVLAGWLAFGPTQATGNDCEIAQVCRAVESAARHVPFSALCLPQAMAAKAMLARRGFGSTFHLGASRSDAGAMTAHAWLAAGGRVVIGASGMQGVSPLARFG